MKNLLIFLCLVSSVCFSQDDTHYVYHQDYAGGFNHTASVFWDTNQAGHGAVQIVTDGQEFNGFENRAVYAALNFDLDNQYEFGVGVTFKDARLVPKGIEYSETGYVTQLHSLTDREYVDTNKPQLLLLTSDPAGKPDGYIYYNTTTNKIRVKIFGTFFSLVVE